MSRPLRVSLALVVIACIGAGALALGTGGPENRTLVFALLAGATFMFLTNMQWIPGGGEAIGFSGATLVFATAVNFVLGAFNALGIGSYAPSLIVFSLLGMDPRAAFPIMMGSGAFVATIAGVRFVRRARFHGRAALGLTAGGIPGVVVAAWLVQSLPLDALRWLVLAVVAYASTTLLKAGLTPRATASA